jgi:hypothetical protein
MGRVLLLLVVAVRSEPWLRQDCRQRGPGWGAFDFQLGRYAATSGLAIRGSGLRFQGTVPVRVLVGWRRNRFGAGKHGHSSGEEGKVVMGCDCESGT